MITSKIRNPRVEGDDFPEFEAEEGEVGRRVVEVNGQSFICIASEPFGFFKIKLAGGGHVPQELAGSFTTVHDVERAIKVYVGKLNSQ